MHEVSLLKDLLRKIEEVARENYSDRVVGVVVKLGALAHISPEHFREHFEIATAGTMIEGADLQIELGADINDEHAQEIMLANVELAER
jgi:hydrogenase nickel incorporation protein HypA/HybF